MRNLIVRCDECGQDRPTLRPATWWILEDQGAVMRTAPLDFGSLLCLVAFLADPAVRLHYQADFPHVFTGAGNTCDVCGRGETDLRHRLDPRAFAEILEPVAELLRDLDGKDRTDGV